ncbi:MAG: sulfur carrier protein ThiS adenylyltransferase ThiF [Fusobacteria bacterium]|nr:sulfur carrier protein ThiS adenylyltransferase ThiF [Fusobacteriota bacterium]
MKIGIAGVGGIGSNVAMYLVRAGFTKFKIIDFDIITESNLNRQFFFKNQVGKYKVDMLKENLENINGDIIIEKEVLELTKDNMLEKFNNCNIIVEGFDIKERKIELLEVFSNSNKLIVSANGIGGLDLSNIVTKKLGKNIFIVGDFKSDIIDYKTYSTKVSIIAGTMANIIIEKHGVGVDN